MNIQEQANKYLVERRKVISEVSMKTSLISGVLIGAALVAFNIYKNRKLLKDPRMSKLFNWYMSELKKHSDIYKKRIDNIKKRSSDIQKNKSKLAPEAYKRTMAKIKADKKAIIMWDATQVGKLTDIYIKRRKEIIAKIKEEKK